MEEKGTAVGTGSTPRLPEPMEKALWERVGCGDDEAREQLILAYRPLVFWMAKRYFHTDPFRYADLIQEGMVALITALDRFDPSRNFRFSTFAFYRIRGRMSNFLQRGEQRAPVPMEQEQILRQEDPFDPETLEWLIAVEDGLDQLPARETQILEELVLEGRRAREIAEDRGMDVSHVYKIRKKAIGRLRQLMGLDGPLFGAKRG